MLAIDAQRPVSEKDYLAARDLFREALDLAEADIRGVQARNVQLDALLNSPLDGAGDTQIVWDGHVASASWSGYEISNASSRGRDILDRLPSFEIDSILNDLQVRKIPWF